MDLVDGVWCEVVYALDKQLRWIEKNFQPGSKARAGALAGAGARDEDDGATTGGWWRRARCGTRPGRW